MTKYQRSLLAHTNASKKASYEIDRGEYTKDPFTRKIYHSVIISKMQNENRILTKKEKKRFWNNVLKLKKYE